MSTVGHDCQKGSLYSLEFPERTLNKEGPTTNIKKTSLKGISLFPRSPFREET